MDNHLVVGYAGKPVGEKPTGGSFKGYDHLHFWVGNAKQAAGWYTARFGFEYYAYKGLETGCREVATHVVRNKQGVTLAFSTPYGNDKDTQKEMNHHQSLHGDGVKDVAFGVEDCHAIYNKAISRGAKSSYPPQELKDDFGSVIIAGVHTYGDTIHTFIQRNDYKGFFMPGFVAHPLKDPLNKVLPDIEYSFIDHIVGN